MIFSLKSTAFMMLMKNKKKEKRKRKKWKKEREIRETLKEGKKDYREREREIKNTVKEIRKETLLSIESLYIIFQDLKIVVTIVTY